MKRLICILTLFFAFIMGALSQPRTVEAIYKNETVRIEGVLSDNGKTIIAKTLTYAPLTKLEKEVKDLREQVKQKEAQISKLKAENSKLSGGDSKANELSTENARLQRQNEQLSNENAKLRSQLRPGGNKTGGDNGDEIAKLKKELQKMKDELATKEQIIKEIQKKIEECEGKVVSPDNSSTIDSLITLLEQCERYKKYWNTDYISFQMDFGFSFMKNSLTKQDFWGRGSAGAQQFEISYTHYLSDDSPIAFRAGLGLGLYHGNGAFASMKDTIEKLKDDDGDTYHAYYSFRDVSEEVTLSYLEIPLLLHIGNSCTNQGVQAWGEVGFKIGLNVGTSFTGNGKYTLQNFYPKWNVLVHDISELGLVTDESLYSENMEHEVNTLVLWGQLAGGIMVPLTDQIHFNAGVRMGYTFSTIAKEAENPNNYKYILGKSNLLAGSGNRIFTIGMDLGIVYAF